jgi:hypothetical protein
VKFALVAPAGTITVLGTVATFVLLLLRFTTNPPDGAGAVRVTVPVLLLPPTTLVGFRLRLLRLGCVGPIASDRLQRTIHIQPTRVGRNRASTVGLIGIHIRLQRGA